MRACLLLSVALAAPLALAAPAPLLKARDASAAIADKYIVKVKEGSEVSALDDVLGTLAISADFVYDNAFKGFAATLDAATLKQLREHPNVEYIEEDSVVSIAAYVTQPNAPWNLARISSRTPGKTSYIYDDSAGEGSCVYVLDTGIDITHTQFGGRASNGANFAGGSNGDGNGHGTAIAGIVGSVIYGVAKKATIISVKILGDNGSGTTSGVIAGINFVGTDYPTRNCPHGAMANLSLGGSFSSALNSAVNALVTNNNVFVAAAAGNDASNVANYSPASAVEACTVGATTITDAATSGSNYGALLDIWAPGVNILTTWTGGGTQTLSGSSMATAHVSGLGAYLATFEGANPGTLCYRMQELATVLDSTPWPSGTVRLLIFNGNPTG